ncbi:MAG: DJ-1/PfpI family protein [Bacteroidales bacterium]|nr:DJ-1/PfpI family protein [Bacteroidales bacterium]
MKGSYLFLAEGFEETEALATLDVLRRGGLAVKTVSINDKAEVAGSHSIRTVADLTWSEFKAEADFSGASSENVLIFPGGMPGTKNLAADAPLMDIMKEHYNAGGTVAAICAAPGLVASQLDGLEGKKFTCFDGFQEHMLAKGAVYTKAPAVTDGNLVTGRGAGCAIEFGLAILGHVSGAEAVAKVRQGLMIAD